MAKPLRVLIVEDSEDDALLVIRELQRGGYDTTFERVETAEAMTAALEKQVWDIIIADYRLPHFSAPEALELFHQSGLDLPFIVISGTVGEETAVETMKAGAHDYLMKGNLTRLVPTIERELREAEVRKERKRADYDLKERMKELQGLYGIAGIAERPGITLDELYQEAVNLLPASWQYPEITCARITFGDKKFRTDNFKTTEWVQSADIDIKGQKEGTVEVYYLEARPEIDEGPFSKEERLLIDAIAERLGRANERMQAEEDIRKFKTISDRAGYGASIASLEGKFIYINQSYAEMHGYSLSELIGEYFSILYPEDQLEILNKSRNRLLKTGVYFAQELWHKRRDGTIFPTVTTAGLIRDDEGRPLYIYSMVIDITERKQAEEEIEKFKAIADNAAYGVSITGLTGKLLYLNESYARMHGYTVDELTGKHYPVFYPEDQLEFIKRRRKIIEQTGGSIDEIWHKRKDGSLFPALATGTLVKGDKGEPLYIAATHIDITERKRAEEDIKRAAEEWRTTFDSIADLVSIHDKDFKLIRVNKAFADILKMKPAELIGRTYWQNLL